MPVYKPDGLGIATVWPMEFYVAMALEAEDQSAAAKDVIPHAGEIVRYETQPHEIIGEAEEREDKDEWYDIIDDMIDKDMNVLANFIGINTYRYVFENPV